MAEAREGFDLDVSEADILLMAIFTHEPDIADSEFIRTVSVKELDGGQTALLTLDIVADKSDPGLITRFQDSVRAKDGLTIRSISPAHIDLSTDKSQPAELHTGFRVELIVTQDAIDAKQKGPAAIKEPATLVPTGEEGTEGPKNPNHVVAQTSAATASAIEK